MSDKGITFYFRIVRFFYMNNKYVQRENHYIEEITFKMENILLYYPFVKFIILINDDVINNFDRSLEPTSAYAYKFFYILFQIKIY